MFTIKLLESIELPLINILEYSTKTTRQYRRYTIAKRTGGTRTIYHPSKKLKKIQRFIAKEIFDKMPVHESVFSYKKNISIKHLAEKHKADRFLLRIDFKDFFPSLKGENIREFLEENQSYLEYKLLDKELTLINLFVCRTNTLTIGSPSSPIISNVILYYFDDDINNYCSKFDIKYSRYADDLYFSTNNANVLKDILEFIKKYKFKYGIKLKVNDDKSVFTSKKRRRLITGLTLTTDNKVSIGRKQKRYIKSLIFKYINEQIELKDKVYLKGYLSYLKSVEPTYIEILKNKYSEVVINNLFY